MILNLKEFKVSKSTPYICFTQPLVTSYTLYIWFPTKSYKYMDRVPCMVGILVGRLGCNCCIDHSCQEHRSRFQKNYAKTKRFNPIILGSVPSLTPQNIIECYYCGFLFYITFPGNFFFFFCLRLKINCFLLLDTHHLRTAILLI